MNNITKWAFLACIALLFVACSSAPQHLGALNDGLSGLSIVFQDLANSGTIDPVNALKAQQAIEALMASSAAAQQAAELAQQTAEAAKAGTLSPTMVSGGVIGTVAAAGYAINKWQDLKRKKAAV